jgi:molybdopterin/thiamine biosynthesis adenylyltransferase
MALADYFHRSAVAASQVVAGFDEAAIRRRLEGVRVGLVAHAAHGPEAHALSDMAVRLLARLYPTLVLGDDDRLAALARSINPNIELVDADADVLIVIGTGTTQVHAPRVVFAGSDGWLARVGTQHPLEVGESSNPFGPGAAACLAVGNVFRAVFLDEATSLDEELALSTFDFGAVATDATVAGVDIGDVVLAGAGAVGQGALWALERAEVRGQLHVVDPEAIELGNLQRYVLALRADEHRSKVNVACEHAGALDLVAHATSWEGFCADLGHRWERVLVGVDSAAARRQVQASLPRWIANAWTQPGDLGVSVHPWTKTGACLSCLYLPQGEVLSEDRLIADALGLQGMEVEVRRLLFTEQPVPTALLQTIAERLNLPEGAVEGFDGQPLRELYVDGICGGALVGLDRVGHPRQDVHVPIAHQSALAGVLLAAQVVADALGAGPADSTVARINVMQRIGQELRQAVRKDARGICVCQDPVYRAAYDRKWSTLVVTPTG